MKQKDLGLLFVIGFISAVISIVLSRLLITPPKNRAATVTIVEKIDSNFPDPDKKYFNEQSFNPTRIIHIGDNTNQKPFN